MSRLESKKERGLRIRPLDLVSVVMVGGWLAIAIAYRQPLYDAYAIACSTLMLAGTVGFFRWRPSPGREGYRLLGFFVLGQAFLSSGLGTIIEVDTTPLNVTPTRDAFSFAVESTLVFACMFLLGAFATGPREGQVLLDPPTMRSGPSFWVAMAIATATAIVTIDLSLTSGMNRVGALGTLPLVLLNVSMIAPMLGAQESILGRRWVLPLAIVISGQVIVAFYTSMLGVAILTMRDVLLARIYLRRRIPPLLVGTMIAVVVVLNPAKHLFRNAVQGEPSGPAATSFTQASSLWGNAVETVWSPQRGPGTRSSDFDETSRRLDYNWISAHIYRTVPHRLAFEEGSTYAIIPTMLVPRFINPDKPMGAGYARGDWFIKLGIQDSRSVERAALALPAPAEAYWNFGWAGVLIVPSLLGAAVGIMFRFGPRDPVARAGYVVLLVISLGQFLDMVVWIIPAFVTVAIGGFLASFYSRIGRKKILRSGGLSTASPASAAELPAHPS